MLSLKPGCLRFLDYISIPPEKWIEQTVKNNGADFWVIAISEKNVIYYDYVEAGFNLSPITKCGEIDEYQTGQSELHETVENVYEEIIKQKKQHRYQATTTNINLDETT